MSYEALPQLSPQTVTALLDNFGTECVEAESPEALLQAMTAWLDQEQVSLRDANPELSRLLADFRDDYQTLIAGFPLTLRQRAWLDVANAVGLHMTLQALDTACQEQALAREIPAERIG
jgi:predicted nucleotidyltransferase